VEKSWSFDGGLWDLFQVLIVDLTADVSEMQQDEET
jgi:hypothetical protein